MRKVKRCAQKGRVTPNELVSVHHESLPDPLTPGGVLGGGQLTQLRWMAVTRHPNLWPVELPAGAEPGVPHWRRVGTHSLGGSDTVPVTPLLRGSSTAAFDSLGPESVPDKAASMRRSRRSGLRSACRFSAASFDLLRTRRLPLPTLPGLTRLPHRNSRSPKTKVRWLESSSARRSSDRAGLAEGSFHPDVVGDSYIVEARRIFVCFTAAAARPAPTQGARRQDRRGFGGGARLSEEDGG